MQLALLTPGEADDLALAERLCHLDGELAAHMRRAKRPEDAVPYLVSQAWCLHKLGRKDQACNLLKEAQRHCKSHSMCSMLDGALDALCPPPEPASEAPVVVIMDEPAPAPKLAPAPEPALPAEAPPAEDEPAEKPKPAKKKAKKKVKPKAKKKELKPAEDESAEKPKRSWWPFGRKKKEEGSDEQ